MKRKVLALFLSVLLVVGLMAGCGGTNDDGSQSSTTEADGSSTTGTDEGNGEIQKIVVAFPTWSGAPADLAKIEAALNEISREEIGIEASLLVTDFASYGQQMALMMSGTEQLDVIITLSPNRLYATSIQNGQLLDLEENDLIQTYGSGIIEAVGQEYIDACRVGGILYGLPNNRDMARGAGCYSIRTDILESVGFELEAGKEIQMATMADIEEIFAKIHEQYPDMEVYRPVTGAFMQYSNVDYLGGNNFGVLMDYGSELEVVNLFETDYYLEYCQMLNNWYESGYISQDAATDTTAVGDLTKAGVLAAYNTGGKPGIKAQESSLCGYDMTILQTADDFMSSSSVAGFPWAIPLNAVDPVASMKYLDLLYTNEEMMNIICWGIEGEHYVEKEDGFLTFPEGVDASTSGYNHSMNWMFPNQYLLKIWEGNDPELWDNTRAFNNDSKKSAALGFAFDAAKVSTEMTSVSNVYEEYQKSLEFGLMDPATGIAEMNDKMKASGLDLIIAEKEAQLNAWVEANK